MNGMNERGISPVIATVLLVSIALVLAAIVFIWAQAFFVEKITKSGETLETVCGRVNIAVDLQGTTLKVQNNGNVPLAGIDLKKISAGSTEDVAVATKPILPGQSKDFDISSSGVNSGQDLLVVPKLLAQSTKQQEVTVACDNNFGKQVSVP